MPRRIAVEDVQSSRRCVFNRDEWNPLLIGRVWYGRGAVEEEDRVRVLLAKIVIHRPVDILTWLHDQTGQLVFEALESLGLLGAVGDPIVDSEAIRKLVIGAHTHVVERQKIEPVG